MQEYFKQLFQSFGDYVGSVTASTYWWVPLVALVALWLFWLVAAKVLDKRRNLQLTREFRLLSVLVVMAAIVQLIIIGAYMYLWAKSTFYATDGEKLVSLLSLALVTAVQVTAFVTLSRGFARERLLRNVQCPITRHDDERKQALAKKRFGRLKLWALLPLLGFLLLLLPDRQHNLVSFLFDNSSSMESHIENGKQVLPRVLGKIEGHTDIILSWLSEDDPKLSLSEIVNQTDYSKLEGIHALYQDANMALASLDGIAFTKGTPLVEAIWSNYLFTQQQSGNAEYTRMYFVMVTDGGEGAVGDELQNFLCSVPEYEEFYQGNISIVNLGSAEGPFFDKALECGYEVYDGANLNSYATSIENIFKETFKDWKFPVWLAIFYAMGALTLLFIQPKRR